MTLDHRNHSSKLIWMIAAVCIVIIALGSLYFWATSRSSSIDKLPKDVAPPQTTTTSQSQNSKVKNNSDDQAIIDHTSSSNAVETKMTDTQVLDKNIPQNASLAKDELAKLDDIQNQLNQQKDNLESQHMDADRLIKLKQEQIELLEQQLATQQKS